MKIKNVIKKDRIKRKKKAYITSLYRALTILVISCPCAILISVPLAFFSSIGNASKNGILVKGTNYIEVLSKVKNFVFDKTGTMTKGVFEVVGIHHCIMDEKELVKIVAHVENFSNHPIAKSIVNYYNGEIDPNLVKDVTEISGRGLSANVDGKLILVGNDKLMKENNINDFSSFQSFAKNNINEEKSINFIIKDLKNILFKEFT